MNIWVLKYTYPKFLQNKIVWKLWKKTFCKHGWHLWDEVITCGKKKGKAYHYLSCDACDEYIRIKEVKDEAENYGNGKR